VTILVFLLFKSKANSFKFIGIAAIS